MTQWSGTKSFQWTEISLKVKHETISFWGKRHNWIWWEDRGNDKTNKFKLYISSKALDWLYWKNLNSQQDFTQTNIDPGIGRVHEIQKEDWDEGFNNEWQPMHEQFFLDACFWFLIWYSLDYYWKVSTFCEHTLWTLNVTGMFLWFSEEVKFEIWK